MNASEAEKKVKEPATVQWWLAELDKHGNPTLTDGAHSDLAGVEEALYLIQKIACLGERGRKFAAVRVEIYEVEAAPHHANMDAIRTLNDAAQRMEAEHGA